MSARSERPLRSQADPARASAIVSAGLLLTTLIGAGQSFVLVAFVGEGPETDGFLAAYSVYVALALLGVSLRRSLVPLLGTAGDEAGLRERSGELMWRTTVLGLAMTALLLACSPLVAWFMTRGLPDAARTTALATLAILAPAAFLQIRAGATSGVLNTLRRFPFSVAVYVASSAAGLVASAALLAAGGVLGAAAGLLVGSACLLAGHSAYARSLGLRAQRGGRGLADRAQLRFASFLLSGSTLSLAQQLNLTAALAALAGTGGPVTVYTYAYFVVVMMTNLSAYPVALVGLPGSVEAIERDGPGAAREQVLRPAPYIAAVLAPLMLGYVGFGDRVLELVFGPVFGGPSLELLHELGLILLVMVLGYSVFVLAGTVLLALNRRAVVFAVSGFSLAAHTAIMFALAPEGARAVAWGHGIASLLSAAAVLAAVFGRAAIGVAGGLLARAAPAFALAAVFPLAALVVGDDDPWWAVTAAVVLCALAYTAATVALRPAVARPFLRLAGAAGRR